MKKSLRYEVALRLDGKATGQAFEQMGYRVISQTGSHVRLSYEAAGEHRITVPLHDFLRVGTLAAILADAAAYHKLTRDDLISKLFGKN